jgi:hypothetical protein
MKVCAVVVETATVERHTLTNVSTIVIHRCYSNFTRTISTVMEGGLPVLPRDAAFVRIFAGVRQSDGNAIMRL